MNRSKFATFLRDDEGGVAIEYLVLVGTISVATLAAAQEYQLTLIGLFEKIARDLRAIRL